MTEDNIDSNADIKMDVDDDGNDEDVVAELREFSLRRFHSHIESTDDEMLRQLDWSEIVGSFSIDSQFASITSDLARVGGGASTLPKKEPVIVKATVEKHGGRQYLPPIQIYIGDQQNEDLQQPSTSSSLISANVDSQQETKVFQRISELRNSGLWSDTRLPMCVDPPRPKLHWDYLLEEVVWMSADFLQERRLKRRIARKFAYSAKSYFRQNVVDRSEEEQKRKHEREAKKVCASIAKMVREFWRNVDKVVDYRANEIIESQKRKAMDRHLKFLVGEADKISSVLQERLTTTTTRSAESPTPSNRTKSSTKGDDGDFDADLSEDEDDEATIETEEKLEKKAHVEQEVKDLSKESAMNLDDILSSLPSGYLEQFGYGIVSQQSASGLLPQQNDGGCSASASVAQSLVDDESADQTNQSSDTVLTTTTSQQPLEEGEKPNLQNVDYGKLNSKNSDDRRQELDNIADAAMEFQPTGYTLETTQVKTEVPFLICGQLREYQLVGLDWLVTLYEKNLNGILADEMGLGKTIQTIALLAHLACDKATWGPHLIIVPTSVILNWEMEIKKWCPSFKIITYFGTAKERAEKRKGWFKENVFHICVTSYKLATQDIRVFKNRAWQYLILDEAQNIKNFKSQRWRTLLNLRSRRRLLLTGTPLQNSLMELWSLLHFLMPAVFSSHDDFRDWFSNPMSGMVEGSKDIDTELVGRLHKILRPFILRRLKSEVERQLPTKTEKVISCPLSKRQRFLYSEFMLQRSTRENLESGNMLSVLNIVMQLRKCCNHPNLFEPRPVVSPFVTTSCLLAIPKLAFSSSSFQEDLSDFPPSATTFLRRISRCFFTSASGWELFKLISKQELIKRDLDEPAEDPLPIVRGVKFAVDRRFKNWTMYVPKVTKTESSDEHSPTINGIKSELEEDISIIHEEKSEASSNKTKNGINNARKRRAPLPPGANSRGAVKAKIAAKFEPTIPAETSASNSSILLAEIREEIRQKYLDKNRQIALWLTDIARQDGGPSLSQEAISLAKQCANPVLKISDEEEDSFSVDGHFDRQKSLDLSLKATLFRELMDSISSGLDNWMESVIRRFVLCVANVLLADSSSDPTPINAGYTFNRNLGLNHSKALFARQNSLATMHSVYSALEFPELRLIEYDCGKLQILSQLLQRLHENKHRCLIFTQMSKMLDILQSFLSYHNYTYFRLDGSTHIDQRQAMMERFNTDPTVFCFILSTRSGGIGVNLTGADTVIFYDSDWNPTMDAQAQDRCHRIGQTRNVTIYRLISEKTIEENILRKAMQKRRLGEMALDEAEFTPQFFRNTQNIRELFSNEETVADLVIRSSAATDKTPRSTKEIEAAMFNVEDAQDAAAATHAREEYRLETAEFETETTAAGMSTVPSSSSIYDADIMSEQYLMLIKQMKPVERYAVNFLEDENRPELEEGVKEAEALIIAKKEAFLKNKEALSALQDDELSLTYDGNSLDEMVFTDDAGNRLGFDDIPIWMPPSPPNSETETLFYVPIDGWGLYEPNVMTEDRLPPPVAPSITAAFDPLLAKARQMHQQQREATTTGSGGIGRRTRRPSTTTPTTMIPSASGQSESTTVGGILKTEENGGPTGAGVALDGVVIRTGPGRPRLPSRTLAGRPAATAGREKVISSHHDHDVSTTTTPATGVPGHGGSARRRRRLHSTTARGETDLPLSPPALSPAGSVTGQQQQGQFAVVNIPSIAPISSSADGLLASDENVVDEKVDKLPSLLSLPRGSSSSVSTAVPSAVGGFGPTEQQQVPPFAAATVAASSRSINTLDECIENVRRAHAKKQPPISYIHRFPSSMREQFQLPCTEPHAAPLIEYRHPRESSSRIVQFATATPPPEPDNFVGAPWTATQDQQLVSATSTQQVNTQLLESSLGISMNWDLVACQMNAMSGTFPHYRSPKQCALRYQQILHRNLGENSEFRDETPETSDLPAKKGGAHGRRMSSSSGPPSSTSATSRISPARYSAGRTGASKQGSSSQKSSQSPKNQPSITISGPQPPTGTIFFDKDAVRQDLTSSIRKHASAIMESASLRRKNTYQPDAAQLHQQQQLFCLSGRLPPHHEACLSQQYGVRHTTVQRPAVLLEAKHRHLDEQLRRAAAANQQQQQRVVQSASGQIVGVLRKPSSFYATATTAMAMMAPVVPSSAGQYVIFHQQQQQGSPSYRKITHQSAAAVSSVGGQIVQQQGPQGHPPTILVTTTSAAAGGHGGSPSSSRNYSRQQTQQISGSYSSRMDGLPPPPPPHYHPSSSSSPSMYFPQPAAVSSSSSHSSFPSSTSSSAKNLGGTTTNESRTPKK